MYTMMWNIYLFIYSFITFVRCLTPSDWMVPGKTGKTKKQNPTPRNKR